MLEFLLYRGSRSDDVVERNGIRTVPLSVTYVLRFKYAIGMLVQMISGG